MAQMLIVLQVLQGVFQGFPGIWNWEAEYQELFVKLCGEQISQLTLVAELIRFDIPECNWQLAQWHGKLPTCASALPADTRRPSLRACWLKPL